MSGGPLTEALVFLISTLFELYLLAVVLRFLLQLVRADFYNPLSQILVRITNPVLRPIRRLVPGYRGLDWASILLMLAIKALEIFILSLVVGRGLPSLSGLLVMSAAGIVHLVVYIYIVAILIQVVLSWVNPGAYNPATALLYRITEPLLRPARRVIPPMGGLDLSPLAVLIGLQLLLILLVNPLLRYGQALG